MRCSRCAAVAAVIVVKEEPIKHECLPRLTRITPDKRDSRKLGILEKPYSEKQDLSGCGSEQEFAGV
jgi:hypothetical protein